MNADGLHASLATLIGPGLTFCETRVGDIEGSLFASERAVVANAVPTRVEEFRLGRAVARNALAQLGFEHAPIGVADSRAPIWPNGAVGSISHCGRFCGAVVARNSQYRALGIDACENAPLFEGALDQIASPSERAWVESEANPPLALDALLFSIKETIFKLWSPITGHWLGFEEAEVAVDVASGTFCAAITAGNPTIQAAHNFPATVEGKFTYDRAVILSHSSLKT